jgi:spermidine/putrescine-binding protein
VSRPSEASAPRFWNSATSLAIATALFVSGAPPYLWGTTGIGAIPDRVEKLAPDAPLDSWDLLFKPQNAKRIAPCGIIMMDSAIDVIPGVLKYLGKSPDSTDPADLAAVEHTLMGIRPYIRIFASGGAREAMAAGRACLTLDYSGDVIQANARAAKAKRGITVRYIAPKEGAQLGFDMLAIPADAPHKVRLLYTDLAMYTGIVYTYLPFMVLPLYARLSQLDPLLLEAAADLGASQAQLVGRVLWEVLREVLPGGVLWLSRTGRRAI